MMSMFGIIKDVMLIMISWLDIVEVFGVFDFEVS